MYRVWVVGSSPSIQRPGRACSSYLIRTAAAAVLLDVGSGAIGNLQLALDYASLDAIVVSHMHADHFLDLVPLRYGLVYGPHRRATPLPLWLPPGGRATLLAICAVFHSNPAEFLAAAFDVGEYDPKHSMQVGDLTLSFAPAQHYIEAYAIRADRDGVGVTYSGDTAPCDPVATLARGSALFVCEATLGLQSEPSPRGHCSASEAGALAAQAGVARLALTHYYAGTDSAAIVEAASAEFSGIVTAVDDGSSFDVGSFDGGPIDGDASRLRSR